MAICGAGFDSGSCDILDIDEGIELKAGTAIPVLIGDGISFFDSVFVALETIGRSGAGGIGLNGGTVDVYNLFAFCGELCGREFWLERDVFDWCFKESYSLMRFK